jgi:hypothetical protein
VSEQAPRGLIPLRSYVEVEALRAGPTVIAELTVPETVAHWTCGEPGREAVADHALEWALRHAG